MNKIDIQQITKTIVAFNNAELARNWVSLRHAAMNQRGKKLQVINKKCAILKVEMIKRGYKF
jgi:hypothetical protein